MMKSETRASALLIERHTPATVIGIYSSLAAYAILNETKNSNYLVCVCGFLGKVPASNSYSIYFGIPLTEDNETIFLNIPKKLHDAKKIAEGDYVRVEGKI